ncbi:Bro-N domain-containing protein [Blautia massiliensis (ex Durand et al. 2017)]|uniref:BRO-N domain-containing protein n=1 Tax=Blautia massiliensis (ex Durand et al. 2017) TaxID=1737424 RepID=UPI0015700D1B|nr:BRO family protein [Blautia massiliensis (ex Durand et al. 2017)]NSK76401.1 transporter [Blautia massiliensis (ex Durand et al. 2017)]
MNDNLEIFKNEEFGEVRTIMLDDKPYFMASDIAKALGYARPNDAVSRHCRATVKHSTPISGKIQKVNFIPEGDMYRLIAHSKLPSAERFESWIFDEVLPIIRRTGGYINNVDLMVNTYFSDIPDDQKVLVKGLMTNITALQNKNSALNNENDLLAQKNLEWADRPLINALVRAYATSVGNNFAKAWNDFKKELLYKHSINLNSRITNYLNTSGKKTKPKTLDMLDDSEISSAISTIVSLCRENEVDIDYLLNNQAS